jgi:hypothetical protein
MSAGEGLVARALQCVSIALPLKMPADGICQWTRQQGQHIQYQHQQRQGMDRHVLISEARAEPPDQQAVADKEAEQTGDQAHGHQLWNVVIVQRFNLVEQRQDHHGNQLSQQDTDYERSPSRS